MADPSSPTPRAHPLPVHPLLFAAYPILFLFSVNLGEVDLEELWLPMALALVGAAIVFGVARLVVRDTPRAAVLASIAVVTFFGYGHVRSLVAPIGLRGGYFLVAVAVAVLVGTLVVLRTRSLPARLTSGLNVLAGALVLVAVVPIATGALGASTSAATADAVEIGAPTRSTTRDIYYIVPDRYGSRHVLETYYGVEHSELYDRLPELGFHVVENTHANYPRTLLSLASVLNLRYLEPEAERYGREATDAEPLNEMLQEHTVGGFLKGQGYTYVHLGSWWDPTAVNRLADDNPRAPGGSDFLTILQDTTILPQVTRRLERFGLQIGAVDEAARHYEAARFQLAEMERIRQLPGPKFVFLHILLPHPPYVFNPDGSFMTDADTEGLSRNEVIRRQIEFTDTALLGLLEKLLDVPADEQPIVLLQADEGPSPRSYSQDVRAFQWRDATPEELDHKFGILSAYHLPDFPGELPPPGLTPVNSFRLILDGYFGTDLPMLPDRTLIFRDWRHPYDFSDVTGIVRGP